MLSIDMDANKKEPQASKPARVRKELPTVPRPTPEQLRAMDESGRRSADELGRELAPMFAVSEETLRFRHE